MLGRGTSGGGGRLARLGYAVLGGVVVWWTWRALHDPHGFDLRLYYRGGQVAWATGHPERQSTWDGTPLLAAAMAIVTRLFSLEAAADSITVVNAGVVLGAVALALRRLRGQLSPVWWWLTAVALLSFGPIMSTVWWKQFNIIALALALAGFELLRARRTQPAAALIGLSVALKPLVFLLPLILLARRETRRAGALAIGWVVALSMSAQALLAVRAHDLGAINPLPEIQNFSDKAKPGYVWACQAVNFSPGSLLCRIAGPQDWMLQRVAVWVAVALLGACVFAVLRGRGTSSWEAFAFACPLSVMLSPLDWAHYQIVLAPLFVLLLVRFTHDSAGVGAWIGVVAAFALASLMWLPYGTLPGVLSGLLVGHVATVGRQIVHEENSVAVVAELAQYVLLITGVLWYRGHQDLNPAAAR